MAADKKTKMLSPGEISIFCTQVAFLLRSGLPLYDGLRSVLEEQENDKSSDMLGDMVKGLEENQPLSQVVGEAGCFPSYMVHMLKIGEESGRLDDVVASLADYYQREASLRERIRSAVFYPLILVVMMSIVIGVLVIQVLPVFAKVITDLGGSLSSTAAAIMQTGILVSRYGLVVLAVLLLVVLGLALYARSHPSAGVVAWLSRHFGPARRLSRQISTGRLAFALSLLLSSGYQLDSALELLPTVTEDKQVKEKVEACRGLMKEGSSFPSAVAKTGLFTGIRAKMVGLGDRTGTLDEAMARLSDLYEEEIENSLSDLVSLVEPSLVAVLSVVIGVILISVMLPLMNILSSMG